MGDNLVRCRQRMLNFTKSLRHLQTTVEKESLSDIEKAGLIQFFEVAFELSWKVMKDYLISEGYDVKSPREAIKTAFDYGLITEGAKWLEALEKRNLALEIYDKTILEELEIFIINSYYPMMKQLESILKANCGE